MEISSKSWFYFRGKGQDPNKASTALPMDSAQAKEFITKQKSPIISDRAF